MIGVGHTSCPKASEPWHLYMTHVVYFVHCLWLSLVTLNLSCRDLFKSTSGVIIGARCASRVILFSLLFLHKLQEERGERREKKQIKRKKITLKAHQNSNEDNTFRKISTRWIQQPEKKSQTMNRVSHTIRLKVLGLTCLWATCVTCSGHNW